MKKEKIRLICLSGIFAAVIFVTTAYLHIPSHTGYTHIGDGFIYLAASLLPTPYGILAGVLGAFLADCLTGYAMWAPATVIIKALTALCFTAKSVKIVGIRNIMALIPSGALCIGGYYLYESVITGGFVAPLSGIPGYITQWIFSSVLYIILGLALDKLKVKSKGR